MHQTHQFILCVYEDLFGLSPWTSRHVFTTPKFRQIFFLFLVFLFICKSCNLRLKLTEPTSKAAEKYQPKATICFLFLSQDCIFWGAVKTIVLKRLSSESWTGLGWKGTLKDHPVKHFSCFISWKNVTFKIQKCMHQKIRYEAKVPCCWWV